MLRVINQSLVFNFPLYITYKPCNSKRQTMLYIWM